LIYAEIVYLRKDIDKNHKSSISGKNRFVRELIMYAVIKTGGKQHRVSLGDILSIEKIGGSKGDDFVFDEVLMVANGEDIHLGKPLVEGAKVVGKIVEQKKGPKIMVFRMKRRKGYRKKTGHRQSLTSMKITEISI
jgi:large subunit ribosomal protein L21